MDFSYIVEMLGGIAFLIGIPLGMLAGIVKQIMKFLDDQDTPDEMD